MKNHIIVFVLLLFTVIICSCIIRRAPGYEAPVELLTVKGNENTIAEQFVKVEDSVPHIYIADYESLKSIIDNSTKEYQIFFMGAAYCSGSRYYFPYAIEQAKIHSDRVELIPVFANREGFSGRIYDYLIFQEYYAPVFVLDHNKYKSKFMQAEIAPVAKFLKQEYSPDCKVNKTGAGNYAIFKNGNFIFQTTMYSSEEEMIELLKNFLFD